jgi:hypothetical protein
MGSTGAGLYISRSINKSIKFGEGGGRGEWERINTLQLFDSIAFDQILIIIKEERRRKNEQKILQGCMEKYYTGGGGWVLVPMTGAPARRRAVFTG